MRRSPRLPATVAIVAVALLVPLAACGADTTATGDAATSSPGRSTDAGAPSTSSTSAAAAPSPPTSAASAADLPSAIECLTQYRPDAEVMTGAEEPTLRVERVDGQQGATEAVDFPTMSVRVTYVGDATEGRSVSVDVLGATKEPLVHTLYQLGLMDLSSVAFAGGHGFTGLQYVSSGPALLQISCAAIA